MVLKGPKGMAESEVEDLKIIANEALGFSFNAGISLAVITLPHLKVPQIMPINGDLYLVLWNKPRSMTPEVI